ncbi:MAG: hypothetical protein JHC87_09355 [Thermoleophilaceae bacterium]|nr:hypothetical protein [Thermoleophilaceae bacterium]
MPDTPRAGLRRPEDADPFNIAADQRQNVDILDKVAFDGQGTFALRPLATSVKSGTYYFATDTGIIYRSDGATWAVSGKRPAGDIAGSELATGGVGTAQLANASVTAAKLAPSPSWTFVGPQGGAAPAFENGWINYSGTATSCSFYLDSLNIVHLRGVVKSGTIGATIFTLPVGCRPVLQHNFGTISNGAFGALAVQATGLVTAASGSNVWFSLDGASFRADG